MRLKLSMILASGSPRRREILTNAGFSFDTLVTNTDEIYPLDYIPEDVPVFLAEKKMKAIGSENKNKIVLCADTVVIRDQKIYNKPADYEEAFGMLSSLSDGVHKVVTGVCIRAGEQQMSFSDTCLVHFNKMEKEEIDYYLNKHKPYDKAGAYGIQDFLGMVKIDRLEGSYFTVMGLPIHLVYEKLKPFIVYE
ncbi:Maf family protein [Marinilongibacter aquaticus]|uniref:Maf family protein n=1 Tax=Marinilongibacter aquaticus TaxID=2975157 RepID=UPI0021BD454C|nr:Maf family protein [Marinilongibacter aquaticus]UBM58468.1 Maf family protein [Marinilongibacter aquaticus]